MSSPPPPPPPPPPYDKPHHPVVYYHSGTENQPHDYRHTSLPHPCASNTFSPVHWSEVSQTGTAPSSQISTASTRPPYQHPDQAIRADIERRQRIHQARPPHHFYPPQSPESPQRPLYSPPPMSHFNASQASSMVSGYQAPQSPVPAYPSYRHSMAALPGPDVTGHMYHQAVHTTALANEAPRPASQSYSEPINSGPALAHRMSIAAVSAAGHATNSFSSPAYHQPTTAHSAWPQRMSLPPANAPPTETPAEVQRPLYESHSALSLSTTGNGGAKEHYQYDPISLDAIDAHILQSHSSCITPSSPLSSAAPTPPPPPPMVNGIGISPSSSNVAIGGGTSAAAPLAFPLVSRSRRATIANPVPDPERHTQVTGDSKVVTVPQTPNSEAKSTTVVVEQPPQASVSSLPATSAEEEFGDGPSVAILLAARAATRNGKFKVHLRFDRAFFCAGGLVTGRMEVQCLSSSVRIGEMSIEIIGIEEISSDATSTSTTRTRHRLLYRARTLLHEPTAPSDAVLRGTPPDRDGYWNARKANTMIPFVVRLSDRLPSSYRAKIGSIRYIVSCTAKVCTSGNKAELVAHTRSACIYERWSTEEARLARKERVRAEARKRVFMGGDGHLTCVAETTRRLVSAGGLVYVRLGVRNHTKKRVNAVRFTLWQKTMIVNEMRIAGEFAKQTQSVLDSNSRTLTERIFKGHDWRFEPDEEREVTLSLMHGCLSLRHTSLLNVTHILQIALQMQFSKDLTVELPVYIIHPASWSDRAPDDEEDAEAATGDDLYEDDASQPTQPNERSGRAGKQKTGLARAPTRVYSAFYGPQGIELDVGGAWSSTPKSTSVGQSSESGSMDSPSDDILDSQICEARNRAPSTATWVTVQEGDELQETGQDADAIEESDAYASSVSEDEDALDDDLQSGALAPPTWPPVGQNTGTPASTLGRGLLPRSLRVANPDTTLAGNGLNRTSG